MELADRLTEENYSDSITVTGAIGSKRGQHGAATLPLPTTETRMQAFVLRGTQNAINRRPKCFRVFQYHRHDTDWPRATVELSFGVPGTSFSRQVEPGTFFPWWQQILPPTDPSAPHHRQNQTLPPTTAPHNLHGGKGVERSHSRPLINRRQKNEPKPRPLLNIMPVFRKYSISVRAFYAAPDVRRG